MRYLKATVLVLVMFYAQAKPSLTEPTSSMLGLRTVVYMVNDIEQAKNWYTQAFGIEPYFDEPYYVGFNIRGYELGLMPSEKGQRTANVIAYWGTEDLDATFERLKKMGATEVDGISDVGGGIRLGVVQDPFGNALGLIYNPIFKAQ